MEPTLLRPDRTRTYLYLGSGVVCLVICAATVVFGAYAGIVVLVLAAVGISGGIGGFWAGIGLRLD